MDDIGTTEDNAIQAPVVGDRYLSHEQIRLMLDNYARHEGFAVSVRASNMINYRWQCVHGGKYRSTRKAANTITCFPDSVENMEAIDPSLQTRKRQVTTKRTNCPWLVRAGLGDQNLWKITKCVLEHNHELSPHDPTIYHQNRTGPGENESRRNRRKKAAQEAETPNLNPALIHPLYATSYQLQLGTSIPNIEAAQRFMNDQRALSEGPLRIQMTTPDDFKGYLFGEEEQVPPRVHSVGTQTD